MEEWYLFLLIVQLINLICIALVVKKINCVEMESLVRDNDLIDICTTLTLKKKGRYDV